MLRKPHSTTFVGCIGVDKFGQILQEKAEEIGVRTAYYKQAEEQTGLCAALLCGNERYHLWCNDFAFFSKLMMSFIRLYYKKLLML